MPRPVFSRVIHWFRRDLRLTDNPALRHAAAAAREVIPVYILSDWRKHHRWTGPERQEFLCGCLAALEKDVAAAGGRLVFRRGDAVAELEKLVRETKAEAVFANRSPDPFGRSVEKALAARLRSLGAEFFTFKDAALHEGAELLSKTGAPYRVFGPYNRAWRTLEKPAPLPRVKRLSTPPDIPSLARPDLQTWGLPSSGAAPPEAGEAAARKRLVRALEKIPPDYAEGRNRLDRGGSELSRDLRHGALSVREVYHAAAARLAERPPAKEAESLEIFLNELAWRDFHMQILWHFPEVLEHEFNPVFRDLPWGYDEEKFARWRDGLTGFPVVDAGMRELRATGFMHNRARMITAMFLTKDLRLDWRLGEEWFMRRLVDGEIASNNGGWQWCAGTGADAAPYFRVQNPWTQTRRHDPDGAYVRRWVPELKDAPLRALFTLPPAGERVPGAAKDYPPPMLDHAAERAATLNFFNNHRRLRRGET